MKQNLTLLAVSVLILINITGCSVVRFAETRTGYGIKKINKTKMDLDFQLGFNPTDQSLRVTLEYQPYAIYKPRITLTDLGIGLAGLGLLGKVLYDNWDHDYTSTFADDRFDWSGSEPWEKAVMIGVPVDILLYWTFSYPFDRKTVKIEKQPLTSHPYRIELPDHGNLSNDYYTTTGIESIEIRKFLADLGNPSFLRGVETLKFRAATEISGEEYRKDYTVSGIVRSNPSPPSPTPKPNSTRTPFAAIEAQWGKDRLRAGERATLKITARNTSKIVLTEFRVITLSSNPNFDNWELKFGNIASRVSATRTLGFSTDAKMLPQDVSVTLQFKAANGAVHSEIVKILHIIK